MSPDPPPNLPPEVEAVRTRTKEWLAANDPVGAPEDTLRLAASRPQIHVRVIERDGCSTPMRADLRPDRINIVVDKGLVTRVDGIY